MLESGKHLAFIASRGAFEHELVWGLGQLHWKERQASNLEIRGSNPGLGSNFSLEI